MHTLAKLLIFCRILFSFPHYLIYRHVYLLPTIAIGAYSLAGFIDDIAAFSIAFPECSLPFHRHRVGLLLFQYGLFICACPCCRLYFSGRVVFLLLRQKPMSLMSLRTFKVLASSENCKSADCRGIFYCGSRMLEKPIDCYDYYDSL